MNIGVLTSGFFHLMFCILVLINIENILIQREDIVQSLKVDFISETDYTKLIEGERAKKSKPL